MRRWICAVLTATAIIPTLALAYTSPGAPAGFVNDFAGMMDPQSRAALEARLASFARQTGNEIAIATVPSLSGDTVENFAVKLFEEWKVGRKGLDNGVLLLVARDDRKFRIEVGYGLEGALTDAQSFAILQNILTPAFKQGNYAGGLSAAADAIMSAARGEAAPYAAPTRQEKSFDASDWFWVIVCIPLWLTSILARSKSWHAGGIIGGIAGVIVGFVFGFLYWGIIATAALVPLGLLFDYIVSKAYARSVSSGRRPPWWIGGGMGGKSGGFGGFGGFGGGRSGGGGASGGW